MTMIFWVSPDIDQWRVQQEGAYRAHGLFADRDEAIDAARRLADGNAPCLIKIQEYGGLLSEQIAVEAAHIPAAA